MNHGGQTPNPSQSVNQSGIPTLQQQQMNQQNVMAYGQTTVQQQQQQQMNQQNVMAYGQTPVQQQQQQQQPQYQYHQSQQQQLLQQQFQKQQYPQQQEQQPQQSMQQQQVANVQGVAQIQHPQNATGVVNNQNMNAANSITANHNLKQQQVHPQNEQQEEGTFKSFLKQAKENLPTPNKKPSGPNIGFKPTVAMAQRHEDALVSGKRPLYQFQVCQIIILC